MTFDINEILTTLHAGPLEGWLGWIGKIPTPMVLLVLMAFVWGGLLPRDQIRPGSLRHRSRPRKRRTCPACA